MKIKLFKKEKEREIQPVWSGSQYFFTAGRGSEQLIRHYIKAYEASEIIYAAIQKIILAAKSIPWYLYLRQGEEVVEVEDHPIVELLRRPSQRTSWPKFIERAIGFYLVSGNRYIRRRVGTFGHYGEIEVLPSQQVVIKTDSAGRVVGYEYQGPAGVERIPAEEVTHNKMFHPSDGLYGVSPIMFVLNQINISDIAARWTIRLLQNDARPGAVVFVPGILTEEQREALKQQWESEFRGVEKSGGLLIVETGGGGVQGDLKMMNYATHELELGRSDQILLRKICSVYHVPSELLGDPETKTYSNVREARKALYQEATLPLLDELRDELNMWLVPEFSKNADLFVDYDASDIDALSEDIDSLWERVGKAVDRGILTRNQALELMGYGRSENAAMDIQTISASVIPLEAITGGTED